MLIFSSENYSFFANDKKECVRNFQWDVSVHCVCVCNFKSLSLFIYFRNIFIYLYIFSHDSIIQSSKKLSFWFFLQRVKVDDGDSIFSICKMWSFDLIIAFVFFSIYFFLFKVYAISSPVFFFFCIHLCLVLFLCVYVLCVMCVYSIYFVIYVVSCVKHSYKNSVVAQKCWFCVYKIIIV